MMRLILSVLLVDQLCLIASSLLAASMSLPAQILGLPSRVLIFVLPHVLPHPPFQTHRFASNAFRTWAPPIYQSQRSGSGVPVSRVARAFLFFSGQFFFSRCFFPARSVLPFALIEWSFDRHPMRQQGAFGSRLRIPYGFGGGYSPSMRVLGSQHGAFWSPDHACHSFDPFACWVLDWLPYTHTCLYLLRLMCLSMI
jgi:hypothetical protein